MAGTRRKVGPLTPFIDGYRAKLRGLGYRGETIRGMVKVLGQLDRWMIIEDLVASDLDAAQVESFLDYRHHDAFRQAPTRPSVLLLLDLLIEREVIEPPPQAPLSEVDSFIGAYRIWLIDERGLARATVLRYVNTARRFLSITCVNSVGELQVSAITGIAVSSFMLAETRHYSVGAAKGRVAEMRALLRYLHVHGMTTASLNGAVPPVAGWTHTSIPRSFSAGEITALLDSCDRHAGVGVRDFAILMLLCRLGLRCIEITRIELEDIDWRSGQIVIHGKGRRVDTLPLAHDVGDAVAHYLREGRPITDDRHLFHTYRAPIRPIPPDLISDVVRRACRRAEYLRPARTGSGTRWPRRCSPKVWPWPISVRCCVIRIWQRPPSTPKWTSSRCGWSPNPGQERCHEHTHRREEFDRPLGGLPAAAQRVRARARRGSPPVATVCGLPRRIRAHDGDPRRRGALVPAAGG